MIITGKAISSFTRLSPNVSASTFVKRIKVEPLPIITESSIEIDRLNKSIEKLSESFLKTSEQLDDGHYLSKHGPETTRGEQFRRSVTGKAPDGSSGNSTNSSRFFSYSIEFDAYEEAQRIFKATGKKSFSFPLNKPVGEGFLKDGGGFVKSTNEVQAVFKNGKLLTLYPKIE